MFAHVHFYGSVENYTQFKTKMAKCITHFLDHNNANSIS